MNDILRILIIDPGHGGTDPGACANGVIEKDANLRTSLKLKADAETQGILVFMTRTTDVTMSLEARTTYANNIASQYPNAHIVFISVHHNAGGGNRGEYIHSIFRGNGQALAESIGKEMEVQLGQQKKVYEKMGEGNKDYYFVIRNTAMDAIIVEVCFLDNNEDVQIADTVEEQERNGSVICTGLVKYFGIYNSAPIPTPTPTPEPPKPVTPSIPDVFYKVYVDGRWLPEVKNLEDYAGIYGREIKAIECRLSSGNINYRVSNLNNNYYPWVKNLEDYAGDKQNPIDRFQVKEPNIKYMVHTLNGKWLPWVTGNLDYAGIVGLKIDGIKMCVI